MKYLLIFILERAIIPIAKRFGYSIKISSLKTKKIPQWRKGLNLNVGAGKSNIAGFVPLDILSNHYYPKKECFKGRIEYDIRKNDLPYCDGTVDNIYSSHTIEHIEKIYVEKFISESYRVLKFGGVLRISCPDAKFLYKVSCFENDYWHWWKNKQKKRSKNSEYEVDVFDLSQEDCMISILATPRMMLYKNRISQKVITVRDGLKNTKYDIFTEQLEEGLEFRLEHSYEHIRACRQSSIGLNTPKKPWIGNSWRSSRSGWQNA